MNARKLPKNEGEDFAKLLDGALYRSGQGSMTDLAEALETGGDLSQRQIFDSLKSWRREVRPGQTFDLALRVAIQIPELLAEMAERAGFLLVRNREADPRAAAADAARSAGEFIAIVVQAAADGVITPQEAATIRTAGHGLEAQVESVINQSRAASTPGANHQAAGTTGGKDAS